MTAFRLHNVTLGYEGHPAVHHLDGEVASGSLTAVIGPNGSGKSTLLKGLCGAIAPLSGRIDRNGFGVRDMAYLPQVNEASSDFAYLLGEHTHAGRTVSC